MATRKWAILKHNCEWFDASKIAGGFTLALSCATCLVMMQQNLQEKLQ